MSANNVGMICNILYLILCPPGVVQISAYNVLQRSIGPQCQWMKHLSKYWNPCLNLPAFMQNIE